jgi:hypothetical protein
LLRKFKWHAHFKLTTPPPFTHQRLYAELQAQLKEKRLEFLSLVDADSRRHNADLKLEIGQVYQETTPWFIAHQTSDHQWVNRGSSQDARWSLEPVHYDFYERRRTLYIPYRLQVVDLKTGRQVMMVEAQAQVSEVFKASEYQGALDLYDARVPERWGYPLQRRGLRLSTPFDLAVQSQSALVDEIVKRMTYVFN